MGHGFNARDYAASHEPWTFTDRGGRVWPGRDLSAPEVALWIERFLAVRDIDASEKLVRRLSKRLFPWHPIYLWSGDPSARFCQLPPDARKAALDDFFRPRRPIPRPPAASLMSTKPNSEPSSPTWAAPATG